MQLGMIGLGRMGASMVPRLLRDGHACVVHDVQSSAVADLDKDRATGTESLKQMVSQLGRPRAIWLMVRKKAFCTAARMGPDTSSRWSTTASSTA